MVTRMIFQLVDILHLIFRTMFLMYFLCFYVSTSQMAKYQQELDDAINQPLPEGDDDDL